MGGNLRLNAADFVNAVQTSRERGSAFRFPGNQTPSLPRCVSMALIRNMNKPVITAWLKTSCGWSNGVRAILKKYDLAYEEKDIIQNPAFRWEMEQKSGQQLSPCVEINGTMIPDISGEELEQWMLTNHIVGENPTEVNVPLNAGCSDAEHEAMRSGAPLNFKA
jgi:glutaredoxin